MNSIYTILLTLGLTFSFTLVKWLMKPLEKVSSLESVFILKRYIVWFLLMVLAGGYFGKEIYVNLPQTALALNEMSVVVIVIFLVIFAKHSEYSSSRSKEWMVSFSLMFPIGEEILFRGIILSMLSNQVFFAKTVLSIPVFGETELMVLISAIMFGVMHIQYNNFKVDNKTLKQVLFAVVFGVYAGKITLLTGSIVYSAIIHIVANSMTLIYGLKISKKSFETNKITN